MSAGALVDISGSSLFPADFPAGRKEYHFLDRIYYFWGDFLQTILPLIACHLTIRQNDGLLIL